MRAIAPTLIPALRRVITVATGCAVMVGLGAAPALAASADDEQGSGDDAVVYVPLDEPAIVPAPAAQPDAEAENEQASATQRATQAVGQSFQAVASAPNVKLPGTSVPLWWLLVMFLSVPLAMKWRSWTASMFD